MRGIIILVGIVLLGTPLSAGKVLAQSAGQEEAVQPNGAVGHSLPLTAAQRSAIFNAIFRQPAKSYTTQVAASVGASVPHTADLSDLPDSAIAGDPSVANLKYAMAGNDVIVVIDPFEMRVVEVIHNNAKP